MEAILKQDYPKDKYEILLIDNGSTDDTPQIAEDFGATVVTQPDLNVAGLRNYGSSLARGTVYAFIDADVAISERWLSAAIDCLSTDDRIACVGSFPHVPESYGWVAQTWWHLQLPHTTIEKTAVGWLPSMSMAVKKPAFQSIGGFSTDLVTCEDVDFCYRLAETYEIVYCENMKATHYGEANSLKDLFKKERWRGISNYDGIRHHGFRLAEIPSLVLPIYYALLFLSAFFALIFNIKWAVFLNIILILLPPFLKSSLAYRKFPSLKLFLQMLICYFVYCLARTTSQIDWLKQKIFVST
jgi:glycosyltransferase involved in cell wall biosynthesis